MSAQNFQFVPVALPAARQPAQRTVAPGSISSLDLLAAALLTLALIPTFLYFGISLAVAAPLSVLIGLTCRHFFRLLFSPGSSDVFLPLSMVAAYFLMYFALRTIYLTTVPFFARIGRNPYDDYLPAALWCACAGFMAFSLGMESGIARRWLRRLPLPTRSWPRTVPVFRLLVLMLVGLGSLIYLFRIGAAVGNYGSLEFQRHPVPGLVVLLENLTDLSWAATCIFLVGGTTKTSRSVAWFLLGISLGILGVKLAISGGKIALIQPIIEAVIVFHYGKRRFRIWELVAVGVPVLLLAFGVVNFYRFVVIGHLGAPKSLGDVVSRVASASSMLNAIHPGGNHQSALEQMVDRNAGIDALAVIMKYTPRSFSYVYGRHWLEVPLVFVPRQIWKGKPIDLPSAEFEMTYLGLPRRFNGFSSMHLMGDLYRNFSWAGVVGGMFLFGLALRTFYLFCSPGRTNGPGLFLYATLLPQIIHSLEADAGYALAILIKALVLSVGVAVFLGARFGKMGRARLAPKSPFLPIGPVRLRISERA